jgi:hypothetical protein
VADGRLAHSICGDDVRSPAFLDDVAAVGEAMLRLAEATGTRRWQDAALALAIELEARFADPTGGWFQTPVDGEPLIHRPRDGRDSAVPSGSALAAGFLLRLSAHTGEARWLAHVEGALAAHAELLTGNPYASGHLLGVLDTFHHGWEEVVFGGDGEGRDALAAAARAAPGIDRITLALADLPASHPAALGRTADHPTAWVCRGTTCSLPAHTPDALLRTLAK